MLPKAVIKHHRRLGADPTQLPDHLDPGLAGHLDVAEDGVEVRLPGTLQGLVRRRRLLHRIAPLPEERGQQLAHRDVVVHHQ
jgi:hypothetical protein